MSKLRNWFYDSDAAMYLLVMFVIAFSLWATCGCQLHVHVWEKHYCGPQAKGTGDAVQDSFEKAFNHEDSQTSQD